MVASWALLVTAKRRRRWSAEATLRACLKLWKSERVDFSVDAEGLNLAAMVFMPSMMFLPKACLGLLPDLVSAALPSGENTTKAVFSILPLSSDLMMAWFSGLS